MIILLFQNLAIINTENFPNKMIHLSKYNKKFAKYWKDPLKIAQSI